MGYRVLGVLSWGSRVTPKFSAPPSGKTMPDPKNYRGSRTCSTSSFTVPSLVGLGFQVRTGRTKMLSFLSCLSVCFSVCLSVRHAVECQSLCARFRHECAEAQKRFRCPWIGNLCVHPCSTSKVSKNVSALQGLGLVSWQKSDVCVSVSSWTKNRMSRSRLHPWGIGCYYKLIFLMN